jgi:two-component system response regulator
MTDYAIEILLVEDNPNGVELALHSLKRRQLDTAGQVTCDGAEALDLIFGTGSHAGRCLHDGPKVILLNLKLPLVDGLLSRRSS